MRIGLTSSVAVHTLILGWGLVTFSSPRQFDPVSIPSIPVELISFDTLSRVVQGTDRGDADQPSEFADQADQIRLDADNAGVGQRDERIDSDAPATADPSASAAPQTPANKPLRDTRAPGQEISLFDLKPIDDGIASLIDQNSDMAKVVDQSQEVAPFWPVPPRPRKKPVRQQVAAAAEQAPAPPAAAPTPAVEDAAQDTPVDPQSDNASDDIATLLDQQPAASAGQRTTTEPVAQGLDSNFSDAKLSVNEMDALRQQIYRFWNPLIGTEDPDVQKVTVLLTLNQDGTLAARPVVEKKAAGTMGDIAAERAVRAVIRAAPYNLPEDKYQAWKEVRVNFDPRDMF